MGMIRSPLTIPGMMILQVASKTDSYEKLYFCSGCFKEKVRPKMSEIGVSKKNKGSNRSHHLLELEEFLVGLEDTPKSYRYNYQVTNKAKHPHHPTSYPPRTTNFPANMNKLLLWGWIKYCHSYNSHTYRLHPFHCVFLRFHTSTDQNFSKLKTPWKTTKAG